eukprot:scaffold885_cov381-Prasinococcus_capsulatus_cf.AAC.1
MATSDGNQEFHTHDRALLLRVYFSQECTSLSLNQSQWEVVHDGRRLAIDDNPVALFTRFASPEGPNNQLLASLQGGNGLLLPDGPPVDEWPFRVDEFIIQFQEAATLRIRLREHACVVGTQEFSEATAITLVYKERASIEDLVLETPAARVDVPGGLRCPSSPSLAPALGESAADGDSKLSLCNQLVPFTDGNTLFTSQANISFLVKWALSVTTVTDDVLAAAIDVTGARISAVETFAQGYVSRPCLEPSTYLIINVRSAGDRGRTLSRVTLEPAGVGLIQITVRDGAGGLGDDIEGSPLDAERASLSVRIRHALRDQPNTSQP